MSEEAKTTVKAEETKKDTAAKAAPKKKPGRPPKSAAEKQAAPKKKPGRPPKKAAEKQGSVTVLEFGGNSVDIAKIEENVKAKFVAEKHRIGNIKTLNIYVKPEENKAYYVINDGKFTGDVDLF